MKKQSVICIVPTESQAHTAVDALKNAGFSNTDISVLMPDTAGVRDLAYEGHTKAPEGTAAGTTTGAVIGGALGWLAGIGALAIPGVGPFVAAGPIMAALSGAALGAATGGVAGALIGLGIPEYEAKQYDAKLREGNIILSVHTDLDEEAKRAEETLKAVGAKDIKRVGESAVPKK